MPFWQEVFKSFLTEKREFRPWSDNNKQRLCDYSRQYFSRWKVVLPSDTATIWQTITSKCQSLNSLVYINSYLFGKWEFGTLKRVLIWFVMILFLKFKAINSKGVLGLSWQQISCFNCIRDTAYYIEFLNKLFSAYIFNKIALFCEQVNSVSNCQISPCIDKFDRKIRESRFWNVITKAILIFSSA